MSILIVFSLHIYFLQAVEYFCFNLPPISRDSYKTESAAQLTASKIRWEDSTSLLLPTFFLLSACWENLSKIISEFKSSSCSSKFSWAIYPQYPLALHESLCYWAANLEERRLKIFWWHCTFPEMRDKTSTCLHWLQDSLWIETDKNQPSKSLHGGKSSSNLKIPHKHVLFCMNTLAQSWCFFTFCAVSLPSVHLQRDQISSKSSLLFPGINTLIMIILFQKYLVTEALLAFFNLSLIRICQLLELPFLFCCIYKHGIIWACGWEKREKKQILLKILKTLVEVLTHWFHINVPFFHRVSQASAEVPFYKLFCICWLIPYNLYWYAFPALLSCG